jgi:Cu(I)/Ag(I) efflux system periplasmic protein CusF
MNFVKINFVKVIVVALSLVTASAVAQTDIPLADGEIRRVDRETQKITIRHGPIPNINMPPMTMVFQAASPALLDQAKPGDKVKFSAVQERGAYIVTRIEPAP